MGLEKKQLTLARRPVLVSSPSRSRDHCTSCFQGNRNRRELSGMLSQVVLAIRGLDYGGRRHEADDVSLRLVVDHR